MSVDPEAVLDVIRPSRRFRRQFTGSRCRICNLRLHFLDVLVLVLPFGQTFPVHEDCAILLAETPEALGEPPAAEEEDTAEARPETIIVAEEEA